MLFQATGLICPILNKLFWRDTGSLCLLNPSLLQNWRPMWGWGQLSPADRGNWGRCAPNSVKDLQSAVVWWSNQPCDSPTDVWDQFSPADWPSEGSVLWQPTLWQTYSLQKSGETTNPVTVLQNCGESHNLVTDLRVDRIPSFTVFQVVELLKMCH